MANYFGEFDKALENYKKCLPIFEKNHLYFEINFLLMCKSWSSYRKGDYKKAISYFEKNKQLMEIKGIYSYFAWTLMIILHITNRDYKSALRYAKQFLSICEESHNRVGIAKNLGLIGTIYSEKGDFSKALEAAKQSLDRYEVIGNRLDIGLRLNKIGLIYQKMGNLD
jgi:tetratricopeptide (TPR) repeat protein